MMEQHIGQRWKVVAAETTHSIDSVQWHISFGEFGQQDPAHITDAPSPNHAHITDAPSPNLKKKCGTSSTAPHLSLTCIGRVVG